jgi:hypothetical protein
LRRATPRLAVRDSSTRGILSPKSIRRWDLVVPSLGFQMSLKAKPAGKGECTRLAERARDAVQVRKDSDRSDAGVPEGRQHDPLKEA